MISINEKEHVCDLEAPCFQQLSEKAIQFIKNNKSFVFFRKGDQLCKQNTFAAYILFVTNGLAIQYVEGENNKNFNLQLIQPAEFIGLHDVFFSKTYDYSAVAITDCHAILVEKKALHQVMSENPDFTMQLMARYIHQNTNLFQTIEKLQFRNMNGRFADILLYINEVKQLYPDVFRLMSRKQLAEFAGISTESSIKLLKSLEKEGFIALDNKDIEIKNELALKQLSQLG